MNKSRTVIEEAIASIRSFDERERADQLRALEWVASGRDLFRGASSHLPDPHLVSYFVPVDVARRQLLLVDHIKAQLWLPPGGHVEPHEDPAVTVEREMREELGVSAHFGTALGRRPLFITATRTQNVGPTQLEHTDIALWYLVTEVAGRVFELEMGAFRGCAWLEWDTVLQRPVAELDPQMHRFVAKLQKWDRLQRGQGGSGFAS